MQHLMPASVTKRKFLATVGQERQIKDNQSNFSCRYQPISEVMKTTINLYFSQHTAKLFSQEVYCLVHDSALE
jgi:hypothetical protein